jgi:alpha-ketoglutarate-dependent taurine dioxygenase
VVRSRKDGASSRHRTAFQTPPVTVEILQDMKLVFYERILAYHSYRRGHPKYYARQPGRHVPLGLKRSG